MLEEVKSFISAKTVEENGYSFIFKSPLTVDLYLKIDVALLTTPKPVMSQLEFSITCHRAYLL